MDKATFYVQLTIISKIKFLAKLALPFAGKETVFKNNNVSVLPSNLGKEINSGNLRLNNAQLWRAKIK